MNIEVEVRTFLSKEQYDQLFWTFQEKGSFQGTEEQETWYFNSKEDLRIQRSSSYAKVWLKKGNLHDDQREEIEIKVKRDEFESLANLFLALSYDVDIKWLRKRHTFSWDGISVMLDYTKGYGYILELEKMSTEEEKENDLAVLNQKLQELNVKMVPKEEFKNKYEHYKQNWKTLLQTETI